MSKSNRLATPSPDNRQTDADLTKNYAALAQKVLRDPAVFPDEFTAWIPRWIMQNVNFRVSAAQLPLLEALRVVGATGQPSFQNSWVAFGTSDDIPGFYKDAWGIVHLTGTLKSGTVNTTMFTLPAGYRPQRALIFPVVNNGVFGAVTVAAVTGAVTQIAGGSNVYITLSGLTYRAFA